MLSLPVLNNVLPVARTGHSTVGWEASERSVQTLISQATSWRHNVVILWVGLYTEGRHYDHNGPHNYRYQKLIKGFLLLPQYYGIVVPAAFDHFWSLFPAETCDLSTP